MFRDGTEGFPMQFYMQVKLNGVVDRDVLRVAVAEAFRRHPLLNAHVSKIHGRLNWVWAGDDFPEADWNVEQWQRNEPWKKTIDLRKETGIRVWAEQKDDVAELTLQYHHACCDGIGASQFLQDIAVGYAHEYGRRQGDDELPEARPLDVSLLANRGSQEGRRVANLQGGLGRRIRVLLKYSLRYLKQKKIPFASRDQYGQTPQSGLGIRQVELNRRQTRRIRDVAKDSNCSVNDLLVRELIMFAKSWNEKAGATSGGLSLREPTGCVLVPVSLRGPADEHLPACNVVSYVFMARALSMAKDPLTMLESIRDEMQLVHQFQAGWMFTQALDFLKRIPGGLSLMMNSTNKSCMSTTVLSHMGNLFNAIGGRLPRNDNGLIQMGNLTVENIYGIPPLRQGTSVVFSSMMVGGCLKICVRCCDQKFSEEEARELVQHLEMQLERICETATVSNSKVREPLSIKANPS